jgi:hypothetical protein
MRSYLQFRYLDCCWRSNWYKRPLNSKFNSWGFKTWYIESILSFSM